MLMVVKGIVQRMLSNHPRLYNAAKAVYVALISKPYTLLKLKMKSPIGHYDVPYEENIDFSGYETDIKAIAFYLPQFHQIPENDRWWGDNFTEWTNTRKAKPLFYGHYQPREPHDDIGYYDLSRVDVLKQQVNLARQHGIYGFCFYHYWFSGKRLLEKPLDMLLEHPEIDFNFCICWANENWTRRWDGKDKEVLIAQKYEKDDPLNFIRDLTRYLADERYIRVDGKPLILIYKVPEIPDLHFTIKTWRDHCRQNGIGEIAVMAVLHGLVTPDRLTNASLFDGFVEFPPHRHFMQQMLAYKASQIYDYAKAIETNENETLPFKYYRTLMFAWDNTARLAEKATIFNNFSLKTYHSYLKKYINYTRRRFKKDQRFIFINAWNEWAEGTYLEPDKRCGYSLLNATSRILFGLPVTDMVYNPRYEDIKRQIETKSNCSYALISAGIKPGREVLEFGPASGYFTRFLAEEKKSVVDIVELSQEYADRARIYARDCVVGDIEAYDWLDRFGDRQYDYIVFADVLEHVKEPWQVLERAIPLLREDGSVLISLPNIGHNAVLAGIYSNDFTYRDYGVLDRTHLRFFTESTARKMIEHAGLRIKHIDYVQNESAAYVGMENRVCDLPASVQMHLKKREKRDVVQFVFYCE